MAWFEFDESGVESSESKITTPCPVCGRQHITVFRLRHLSDSIFRKVGQYYRYAKHFDYGRDKQCSNSDKNPDWGG